MSKRRGNNEGSITKRTDGRWEARISLSDGKRKSFYGSTRQEVQRKLAEARRQVEDGVQLVGDARQTLGQYFKGWHESRKSRVEKSTQIGDKYKLKRILQSSIADVPLQKLTPQHVQQFYTSLYDLGLAATTMHSTQAFLKCGLIEAVDLGILSRNPAARVKMVSYKVETMEVWSEEEVGQFLKYVNGHRLEALFTLVLSTGLRIGEIIALRWGDINMDSKELHVKHGTQRTGPGTYELSDPKTFHSRRKIMLSSTVMRLLAAHRQVLQKEWQLRGWIWRDEEVYVFPGDTGKRLWEQSLETTFRRLIKKAGMRQIRFHDLRHTCATILLGKGVHVKVVSELLGHADIATTLRTYAHVLPRMRDDLAQIIETIFDKE